MQNILVAVDFSKMTEPVVATATKLAQAFGSTIRLLHVAPGEPSFIGSKGWPQEVRDEFARELFAEHHDLQELADSIDRPGVEVKTFLARGGVAETIVELAERTKTGLIILGLPHRGAFAEMLPRSIVRSVMRHAPCPVMIVPEEIAVEDDGDGATAHEA